MSRNALGFMLRQAQHEAATRTTFILRLSKDAPQAGTVD